LISGLLRFLHLELLPPLWLVSPLSLLPLQVELTSQLTSPHLAAIDLIRKLLEPNADKRLTVSGALSHRWFEMDRQDLEDLYRVRVLEGNVDPLGGGGGR